MKMEMKLTGCQIRWLNCMLSSMMVLRSALSYQFAIDVFNQMVQASYRQLLYKLSKCIIYLLHKLLEDK